MPCFVLFHYRARASLILESPIQSTESKIVKPTVVCTKAQYGNIRTASLVQYVAHYADQLMPKSNMNQRTAQNTKVEKALEHHPAHLCAQNEPYKDICSPFSCLQMTQTEGHLTLPLGSPTHLVRFLDAMFLSCTPKSQPKLSFTLLSVHTLRIIKDPSRLLPKVSYTYLVPQTKITLSSINSMYIRKPLT